MRFGMNLPIFGEYAEVRLLAEIARKAEAAGWNAVQPIIEGEQTPEIIRDIVSYIRAHRTTDAAFDVVVAAIRKVTAAPTMRISYEHTRMLAQRGGLKGLIIGVVRSPKCAPASAKAHPNCNFSYEQTLNYAAFLRALRLTCEMGFGTIAEPCRGGVAEWLKAPVLKTGIRKNRGFESHRLLHKARKQLILGGSHSWPSAVVC